MLSEHPAWKCLGRGLETFSQELSRRCIFGAGVIVQRLCGRSLVPRSRRYYITAGVLYICTVPGVIMLVIAQAGVASGCHAEKHRGCGYSSVIKMFENEKCVC